MDKSQRRWGKAGTTDYWIVKIDSSGAKQWDRTLGGKHDEELRSILRTPDGGYLLGGSSKSSRSGDKSQPANGEWDYWIVKTDALGRKEWDRSYGGTGGDQLSTIIPSADGGYILAGSSVSDASGDKTADNMGASDFWVVKIDASGNKVWDKTLGNAGADIPAASCALQDGGVLVAGITAGTRPDPAGQAQTEADFLIYKLDANGRMVWQRLLGGNGPEQLKGLLSTADGGCLLNGYSRSPISRDKTQDQPNGANNWVVKLDSLGNKVWDRAYGGRWTAEVLGVQRLSDTAYLLGETIIHKPNNASQRESDRALRLHVISPTGEVLREELVLDESLQSISGLQAVSPNQLVLGGLADGKGVNGKQTTYELVDYLVKKYRLVLP